MNLDKMFTRFANVVSTTAGRPMTFVACAGLVVVWAACGPLAGFSETWQLIINTSTTIITFLMVFLIQNTQNRDNAALQAKLDEIIRMSDADNSFIGIEHLTDEELEKILAECERDARKLHEENRRRGKNLAAPRDVADKAARKTKARKTPARKGAAKAKPA